MPRLPSRAPIMPLVKTSVPSARKSISTRPSSVRGRAPAQASGAMERVVELLPQLLEDLSQNGEQGEKKKARKVYKTEIETFDFSGEEENAKS